MRWTLALVVLFVAGVAAAADERMRIEVEGGDARGYQVAVQEFASRNGAFGTADPFYAALTSALDFSGALQVVDPKAFLGPRVTPDLNGSVRCDNWRGIGADALVQGELLVEAGQLVATYRVWDTVRCRLQGDVKRARRTRSEQELLARWIADDIVERFTGRRGVSSTQIAFVSDKSGSKEIYLMEADGSRKRAVTRNGTINLFPSWAPDGRSLLYTSFKEGRSEIWRIYRGSKPGHPLLRNSGDKYRGVHAPVMGLVGIAMHVDGNTDLYSVNSDGGHLERLTSGHSIETSPTFSPDGKQMAFVSDRGGSPQIYVQNLVDGSVRRLTFRGDYNSNPAWSPTGEWIAYAALTGSNFDLYLIDPESGFTTPLVVHPRSDEDPTWSPDGRKIAFSSSRRGRKEIYRIDVDGHNLVRLTDRFGESVQPAWSGWLD